MKVSKLKYGLMFFLLSAFLLPSNTFAQDDKKVNKKIVIIKKTTDKDGNVKVEKTIEKGEDIDVDAIIRSVESKDEKGQVEMEVEVTKEGGETQKENEKEITVKVDDDQIKIMDGDEVEIIKMEDKEGTQVIKTDDGKHIVIKRSKEKESIEQIMEDIEIDISEGGEKEIRIIEMEIEDEVNEDAAFFGVLIDPSAEGMELLNVVDGSPAQKAGLQRGDRLRSINGKTIKSYEELTETLSQFKPEDSIEVVFNRNQKSNKVKAQLVRRGDVAATKKMMWKTEDGKEIEINDDKKLHFHGKDKDGKVKKEKIIIKKKMKKEKE